MSELQHGKRSTYTNRGCRCELCTAATRDYSRANYKAHQISYRKWKNGLSVEQFNALLLAQDFRCAICKSEFTDESGPRIDHDHACCPGIKSCEKCVRGLLCHHCNTALGLFKDNLDRLLGAVDYLSR